MKKHFGSLYLNFKTDTWSTYALMIHMFYLRRLFFVLTLVINPTLQTQLMFFMYSSLLLLCAVIHYRPYNDSAHNLIEILNETMVLATGYFVICFSDFVTSVEVEYKIGWVFLIMMVSVIVLNWIILSYDAIFTFCYHVIYKNSSESFQRKVRLNVIKARETVTLRRNKNK